MFLACVQLCCVLIVLGLISRRLEVALDNWVVVALGNWLQAAVGLSVSMWMDNLSAKVLFPHYQLYGISDWRFLLWLTHSYEQLPARLNLFPDLLWLISAYRPAWISSLAFSDWSVLIPTGLDLFSNLLWLISAHQPAWICSAPLTNQCIPDSLNLLSNFPWLIMHGPANLTPIRNQTEARLYLDNYLFLQQTITAYRCHFTLYKIMV